MASCITPVTSVTSVCFPRITLRLNWRGMLTRAWQTAPHLLCATVCCSTPATQASLPPAHAAQPSTSSPCPGNWPPRA
eukprot:1161691-Pelagomonas_calceolata.AAC.4